MPWQISRKAKGCDGFAVVKEGENKPIPGGCHKTRKEAVKHLIAIRLGYEGREQPRDPDGKFASTGGKKDEPNKGRPVGKAEDVGTGKPVAVAKPQTQPSSGRQGNQGSRMKTAPKNVTSKGVNPNSEYVLSEKTGNVFKNPEYNGDPSGRGKVSPNGRNRDQQSDFAELGGGEQFQATGQAKHKEGARPSAKQDDAPSAGRPASSGKKKVGKKAPNQVEAREVDVTDPKVQERLYDSTELGTKTGKDDLILGQIASEQGMAGKPLRIEDDAMRDALVAEGWTVHYRGTKSERVQRDFGEEFVDGEYFPGLGVHGNGTYMSNNLRTAESYSGGGDFPDVGTYGNVNEILLSPDARIVPAEEVWAWKAEQRGKLAAQEREAQDMISRARLGKKPEQMSAQDKALERQGRKRLREVKAMQKVIEDDGRAAALMGVDGIRVGGGQFRDPKTGKPVKEYYTVVVNRTAVASRVIRKGVNQSKRKPQR